MYILNAALSFILWALLLNKGTVKMRIAKEFLFIGANSYAWHKLVENQTMPVIKILNQLKEFWYIYL